MATRDRIYPGDGDPRHGTANGYKNLKCKCQACAAAHAAYCHRWMHADPSRLARQRERVQAQGHRLAMGATEYVDAPSDPGGWEAWGYSTARLPAHLDDLDALASLS